MNTAHHNNFDFIRFVAATMVWYGHCYALYSGHQDWLCNFIPFEDFGSLGVAIFFIISGYFVTGSYDRQDRLLSFCRNRALRIFPALIVVVFLSVFALGPFVTSLAVHDYFAQAETWRYLKSVLVFPLQYELPGVFTGNPAHAVNGSLWSLQQELRCYGIVAILGVLGILRPRVMAVILIGLCGIRLYGAITVPPPEKLFAVRWGKLELAVRLASQFAVAALLYLARDRIALKTKYLPFAILLALFGAHLSGAGGNLLFDMSLAYFVIWFGFLHLPVLPHFSRFGDFSYGMYLYAFPMQQLTLHWLKGSSFGVFMAVSFALTLLCAILSWHIVEKPALAFKR